MGRHHRDEPRTDNPLYFEDFKDRRANRQRDDDDTEFSPQPETPATPPVASAAQWFPGVDTPEPAAEPEATPEVSPDPEPYTGALAGANPEVVNAYVNGSVGNLFSEDRDDAPVHTATKPKRPWIKYAVIGTVAVLTLTGVGLLLWNVASDGDDKPAADKEDKPAASAPATPGKEAEDKPETAPEAPPEKPAKATDPHFVWYGDGLTTWAVGFSPIVGPAGTDYALNADNSTTPQQAVDAIVASSMEGTLPEVVVYAHGTNYDVDQDTLDKLIAATAEKGKYLILVGAGTSDPDAVPWASATNDRYRAAAEGNDRIVYVNWQAAVDADPSVVETGDAGFLLTESGAHKWSGDVNAAIASVYDPATLADNAQKQRS